MHCRKLFVFRVMQPIFENHKFLVYKSKIVLSGAHGENYDPGSKQNFKSVKME